MLFFCKWYNSYSRIDFILLSENLLPNIGTVTIGNRILSDHAPVTIEWKVNSKSYKSRGWRLNNLMLEAVGLEEQINKGTTEYYEWNRGTAPMPVGML